MKPDLSRLRDIHLPDPVSWWPPAPGWWALLTLAVVISGIAYAIHLRSRAARWRRRALIELAQLRAEPAERVLPQLSVLLRRVAITRFPRHDVAALTGERWLAFLDGTLGDGTPFQSGSGRALQHGPYAEQAQVDVEALLALCERWIKNLPARGAR